MTFCETSEHQVVKNLGPKAKTMSKLELRKECRAYADQFIDIQREEFKRLGIFGRWDEPYRTMDFDYEAQIAREFGKIVEKGYVYRSRRSIHCAHVGLGSKRNFFAPSAA